MNVEEILEWMKKIFSKEELEAMLAGVDDGMYDSEEDEDKEFEELLKGLQIDLDGQLELFPTEEDDKLEITKKSCTHPKKKKMKFQTFEYWYCPNCKREIKDDE